MSPCSQDDCHSGILCWDDRRQLCSPCPCSNLQQPHPAHSSHLQPTGQAWNHSSGSPTAPVTELGLKPRSPESPPRAASCWRIRTQVKTFLQPPTSHGIAAPKGTKYPSQTSIPGGTVDRQNPELLSPGFPSLLYGSRPEFSKHTRNLPWTCPRFAASRKPLQLHISLTNQLWGKQLLW